MAKAKYHRKRKGGKRSKNPLSAKKRSHNQEVYNQRILVSSLITPVDGSGVTGTSNYVNMFCSPAPGQATANISSALVFSNEFGLYRSMYDQLRVHSIKVRIIPRPSQTEAMALMALSGSQIAANNTLTVGKNVYYSAEDRDGIAFDGQTASVAVIKRNSSCRVHRMDRVSTRTYRVKNTGDQWFDCQRLDTLDQLQKAIGMWGGLTYYGESFPELRGQTLNGVWADLEVTYNISFRGKNIMNLSVDDVTGAITLNQPDVALEVPVQVFKSHDQIPNFGSIDLSGNVIGLEVFEPPA